MAARPPGFLLSWLCRAGSAELPAHWASRMPSELNSGAGRAGGASPGGRGRARGASALNYKAPLCLDSQVERLQEIEVELEELVQVEMREAESQRQQVSSRLE